VNYVKDHVWDTDFIKGQIESLKEFERLKEKYAFNTSTRLAFNLAASYTLLFIEQLKKQYKEDYA
jgi:hypothetical protein